ncbi:MAG: transporter [Kofleriaceae bacterium]
MRTLRWWMGAAAAVLALPSSTVADPPFDPAIDVQTFEYAVGPKTFFTVSDADVASKKQLSLDILVTYLTKPFTVYNYDPMNPDDVGTERSKVVERLTAAQITAAYGVSEKFQLGVNLPIIFSLNGQGLMANTAQPTAEGLNVTGIGDLLVEGKYSLYRSGPSKLAGIVGVTLPSSFGSDDSQFIGDDLPALRVRLAGQYQAGRLSIGANGGALLRKSRTIYDSTIGPQLLWGVAAAVNITSRVSVVGEGYGRTGIPDFSLDASPLEVEGGLRVYATNSVAVVVGGGTGLVKGIGSPTSRFFLAVGYSPDVRDSDGDGITNARDKCPLIPEDRDGHTDDDGCPDDDDDGDRRADDVDKCPAEAEDIDGFDDDDGCPELDNDRDGKPDLEDKCPLFAEDGKPPAPNDGCPADRRDSDGDGVSDAADACPSQEEDLDAFEDGDGCPEADNDQDGVPDAADKCVVCAEDKDGYEDDDGCPDIDNDHDGVIDAKDACPAQPETVNGVKDTDGCPDTGGAALVRLDGDRLVVDKAPTLQNRGLSRAGQIVVDQMSIVMIAHPEVTKWLIAVADPKSAQKLGDAIKAWLVAKGLPAERIEILAATGPTKVGAVVQERAGDDAKPMCPAGEVKGRPEAEKPGTDAGAAPPADAKPAPSKAEPKKAEPKKAEPAKEPEIEIE